MEISVREFAPTDAEDAARIWNTVVDEGVAFPQMDDLTAEDAAEFFQKQTYTGIGTRQDTGEIVGLYILHPNNVGRCGHICNTSYAVKKELRHHHIGEVLVRDSIRMAKKKGFRILQFNAVVASNTGALNLYRRLGFVQLGTIPGGFLMPDGSYEDIIPHYYVL